MLSHMPQQIWRCYATYELMQGSLLVDTIKPFSEAKVTVFLCLEATPHAYATRSTN
jgi:hypothetical protein